MKSINVLGVSSSMRKRSFGTMTLKIVLDTTRIYEVKTRLLELRKVQMPIFDPESSMQSDVNLQTVTDDGQTHSYWSRLTIMDQFLVL